MKNIMDAFALSDALAMSQPSVSVLRPSVLKTPLVVACPHAGRDYSPAFLKQSRLDLAALRRCEDAYVDEIFHATPQFGGPLLQAHFPRVYCDVNRAAWELDPGMFSGRLPLESRTTTAKVRAGLGMIPRVAMAGKSIYRERLTVDEAYSRIENCWQPYHENLQALMKEAMASFGCCVVLDVHSMPRLSRYQSPDIVLGDRHGTSCAPEIMSFIQSFLQNEGFSVTRNNPYAGGYVTEAYGKPASNVHVVQMEIARSLYMNEANLTLHENFWAFQSKMNEFIALLAQAVAR
ncbi:N-formylglutamate amidohydrolase [Kozakia baliensis]|nr:N-formylglutamate amidohydrolase [Kozakia baliensis]